jgi:hypothetical protein
VLSCPFYGLLQILAMPLDKTKTVVYLQAGKVANFKILARRNPLPHKGENL